MERQTYKLMDTGIDGWIVGREKRGRDRHMDTHRDKRINDGQRDRKIYNRERDGHTYGYTVIQTDQRREQTRTDGKLG